MDKVEIRADWHKLMEDGHSSAIYYFHGAIECIDKQFGEGYSKEHPELIGAFMNAAVKDNQATIIGKCILSLSDELAKENGNIAISLQNIADELSRGL